MSDRYSEIDEVIKYMNENIHEPLSLPQLAKYAAYSPYHFTRIFKERMGISPLYYVSSLRLQKAKDMLLSTNLKVRDIGMEVGQQSLGTFTTRFTERVGLSPAQFRNSPSQVETHLKSLQNFNEWTNSPLIADQHARVEGIIQTEESFEGVILIGLFSKSIPEGLPQYGTLLSTVGNFCFRGVKPGIYYLMATAVSWEMQTNDILLPHTTLRARLKKPIIVDPHLYVSQQHLTLHRPRLDDPPILVSLPLLMNNFLTQFSKDSNR